MDFRLVNGKCGTKHLRDLRANAETDKGPRPGQVPVPAGKDHERRQAASNPSLINAFFGAGTLPNLAGLQ